jgi:hypothetical protein
VLPVTVIWTLTGDAWALPARSVAPEQVSVTGPVGPPVVDKVAFVATPESASDVEHDAE